MSSIGITYQKVTVEENAILVENNFVKYSDSLEQNYRKKWFNLKEKGVFLNDNYDDDVWTATEFNGNVNFKFKYKLNIELNNALKCFIIIGIDDRQLGLKYLRTILNDIREAIDMTKNFDYEYINDYRSYLCEDLSPSTGRSKRDIIALFANFYSVNDSGEYAVLLSKIKFGAGNVRTIAEWSSIIEFEYLLNKFFFEFDAEITDDMRNRYLPLLIWWRLQVIPMRPIELTLLKRDCLIIGGEKYYLKIKRAKCRRKAILKTGKVKRLDKIEIDKDMAELIERYQNVAIYEDGDRFLLSYRTLNSLSELTDAFKEGHLKRKNQKDYMSVDILLRLLNEFYDKIISKHYCYKVYEKGTLKQDNEIIQSNSIERINPGDTRHLGFCSMMLQGFNPLTIAQIGGHDTLHAQYHYCQHLETLVKGKVNMLCKRIKLHVVERYNTTKDFYNSKKELKMMMIREEEFRSKGIIPRSIQDGLCWNEDAPEKNCFEPDCFFCGYYTFESVGTEILDTLDERFQNEIGKAVMFLKELYTGGMNIDAGNETYSLDDQTQLKTAARRLDSLIAKYALVKTHISKSMEIESYE